MPRVSRAGSGAATKWLLPADIGSSYIVTRVLARSPDHPLRHDACHGDGVHQSSGDAPAHALGRMQHAKLLQNAGTVVIDFLTGQSVLAVEGEDAAERKI